MHTGVISFCDRIAYNIKCSEAKDWILDELEKKYQIRILQKHWFRLDEQQFKYVQTIPHKVCIRSNGNPYFLYFTKYEDVNQIMYIDKKVQPGYQKPRIILTKGKFNNDIFQNTLLEGEMVKDKYGKWIFLVNDMIMYKGKYLKDTLLPDRISLAHEMFDKHYKPDHLMDVCQYHVKKYASCTQGDIEKLLLFSEKLPYTNRGMYFVPLTMKYKPKLINFNDELIKTVFRKVKDSPMFMEMPSKTVEQQKEEVVEMEKQVIPFNISLEENEKLLWLRKTEQPDIYDIYEAENSLQKIGVAYVPSLITSKYLRNIFKNLNVATSICFRCSYDTTFQKWIPLEKI